jgi:hypothetical protein
LLIDEAGQSREVWTMSRVGVVAGLSLAFRLR